MKAARETILLTKGPFLSLRNHERYVFQEKSPIVIKMLFCLTPLLILLTFTTKPANCNRFFCRSPTFGLAPHHQKTISLNTAITFSRNLATAKCVYLSVFNVTTFVYFLSRRSIFMLTKSFVAHIVKIDNYEICSPYKNCYLTGYKSVGCDATVTPNRPTTKTLLKYIVSAKAAREKNARIFGSFKATLRPVFVCGMKKSGYFVNRVLFTIQEHVKTTKTDEIRFCSVTKMLSWPDE